MKARWRGEVGIEEIAERVVIEGGWKRRVTSHHSSDERQSLIGTRGGRTRELEPQSTNTSNWIGLLTSGRHVSSEVPCYNF